jgi:hypothetical protein
MFNWFRPSCPLDAHAKHWIERRLQWLTGEFGHDVFARRAMILPLAEFFPDKYDASEASARVLLNQVCRYMDADPSRVVLEFYTDRSKLWLVNRQGDPIARPAGLYQRQSGYTLIQLETSQLGEPMTLVGTMAHELAHLRLMGEGRVDGHSYDNELLTDLTVVFNGLGIFLANVPRAWVSGFDVWPGTKVPRPEYMTAPMYGYALAHAAWHRGERKPAWAAYLRMDARYPFKQALQYLWETGDSLFKPPTPATRGRTEP